MNTKEIDNVREGRTPHLTMAPYAKASENEPAEPTRPESTRIVTTDKTSNITTPTQTSQQEQWGQQFASTITSFSKMSLTEPQAQSETSPQKRKKIIPNRKHPVFTFGEPTQQLKGPPSPWTSENQQSYPGTSIPYSTPPTDYPDLQERWKPPRSLPNPFSDTVTRPTFKGPLNTETPLFRSSEPFISSQQPMQCPPIKFSVKDFPIFSGKDIESFFREFEFLLQVYTVPVSARYQLLTLLLTAQAASWYKTIGRDIFPYNYETLKNELYAAFQPPTNTRAALREFYLLQQKRGTSTTSFVLEVFEKIEILQLRFTEQEAITHITDRLLYPARQIIQAQWPTTKRELFYWAKKVDDDQDNEYPAQPSPQSNFYDKPRQTFPRPTDNSWNNNRHAERSTQQFNPQYRSNYRQPQNTETRPKSQHLNS